MFNFLLKLFSKKPTYFLGSLDSGIDPRDINIASIQRPVMIPEFYITDISMLDIENQGNKPSCVGYAVSKVAEYYIYKQTGKVIKLSARALYAQAKREDGNPDKMGTYAPIAAKILVEKGIPTDQQVADNTDLNYGDYIKLSDYGSNEKVTTGYVFVDSDLSSISQAIYQNGMVSIGIYVGEDWFSGIIGRALKVLGGHETCLNGYDKHKGIVYGVNSWGKEWIGQIAGTIDPRVKPGCYSARLVDIQEYIMKIMAFAPIPKAIVNEVKNTGYYFKTSMKIGMTSYEVKKLQEKLGVVPQSGYFGLITQKAVQKYQSDNGLYPDGMVGVLTREKLNVGAKTFTVEMIKDIITKTAISMDVEPELALAVAEYESGFNPLQINENRSKATGKVTSVDKGLYQWNNFYHKEITEEMAFDPQIATKLFCTAVKSGKLHAYWSASEHNWSGKLSTAIKNKYGIV